MSDKIYKLNMAITIADTIVCLTAVVAAGWMAYHFDRWWINLFSLFPVLLFHAHGIILEEYAKEGEDDGAN